MALLFWKNNPTEDWFYGKYMAWSISVGSFKGPVVAQEQRMQPKNIMPKQFRVSQNLNSKVYNLAWAIHRATQRCQSVVQQIPLKNAAIQPSCSPKVGNPSSLTFRFPVPSDACKARPFSSTTTTARRTNSEKAERREESNSPTGPGRAGEGEEEEAVLPC